MNIHNKPKNKEERDIIRAKALDSCMELTKIKIKVTCSCCNKKFELDLMFRCYYCGLMFCNDCAEIHFGKRESFVDIS